MISDNNLNPENITITTDNTHDVKSCYPNLQILDEKYKGIVKNIYGDKGYCG